MKFVCGIFIILHGLVHLLYFGQSRRLFELQPGMTWPDGSWLFAKFISDKSTRTLAGIACVLNALGFAAGGASLLLAQAWWRPLVVGSAALSALAFILFWNGRRHKLGDQGLYGILINVAILVVVFVIL
ncbi:MAG: hypothetical protein ACTSXZ_03070 [Alphaproteobacteria bacterium]